MLDYPVQYKNMPRLLCEDIYFFDLSGEIISSRCARDEGISNIYSIMTKKDVAFISDAVKGYELRPFIIADTKLGPVFIVRSLFPGFRVLLAIKPNFERNVTLAIAKHAIPSGSLAAPSCERIIESDLLSEIKLDDEHIVFGRRIYTCFSRVKIYAAQNISVEEKAERVAQKISAFSELFGCNIDFSFNNTFFNFEGGVRFSLEGLLLALVCFCLIARKYSADRAMRLELCGSKEGVYCNAMIGLCSDLADGRSVMESPELQAFSRHAPIRNLAHTELIDNGNLLSRWYLRENDPRSLELKVDPKFKFN